MSFAEMEDFTNTVDISLPFLKIIRPKLELFCERFGNEYGILVEPILVENERYFLLTSPVHSLLEVATYELSSLVAQNITNIDSPLLTKYLIQKASSSNVDISSLQDKYSHFFRGKVLNFLLTEDPSRSCVVKGNSMKVSASNEDCFNIFLAQVNYMIHHPAEFQAELDLKKQSKIHIHVDASNILLDMNTSVNTRRLVHLVSKLRDVQNAVVTGSTPDEPHTYWDTWRNEGFRVNVLKKVNIGGRNVEQAVDDTIHASILEDLLKDFGSVPRTLVILTGDGNKNDGRTNFPAIVDRALAKGWLVEVWSWKKSMARVYEDYAAAYPNHFKYFNFDPYKEFLQPEPLSTKKADHPASSSSQKDLNANKAKLENRNISQHESSHKHNSSSSDKGRTTTSIVSPNIGKNSFNSGSSSAKKGSPLRQFNNQKNSNKSGSHQPASTKGTAPSPQPSNKDKIGSSSKGPPLTTLKIPPNAPHIATTSLFPGYSGKPPGIQNPILSPKPVVSVIVPSPRPILNPAPSFSLSSSSIAPSSSSATYHERKRSFSEPEGSSTDGVKHRSKLFRTAYGSTVVNPPAQSVMPTAREIDLLLTPNTHKRHFSFSFWPMIEDSVRQIFRPVLELLPGIKLPQQRLVTESKSEATSSSSSSATDAINQPKHTQTSENK